MTGIWNKPGESDVEVHGSHCDDEVWFKVEGVRAKYLTFTWEDACAIAQGILDCAESRKNDPPSWCIKEAE